jgi:protein-S-isoprenylcysteine O-methyltransferase Ste14
VIARHASFVALSVGIFLLAPAFAGRAWLMHPAPWLGFVLGVVTMASQPPLTPQALVTDAGDKRSALGIFLAVVATNLVSMIDFAHRLAPVPSPVSWWVVAGATIAIGGIVLRLWAIRTLGRFFTSAVMVQAGQRVLTDGPYRWMRHPSYTGSLMTVFGTAVMVASFAAMVTTIVLVLPAYGYRIYIEEKTMMAGLGDDYVAYRGRTPALFPWR